MSRLLFLARGDGRTFVDLNGQSILENFPVPITVLIDSANVSFVEKIEGKLEIHVVKWSRLSAVVELIETLHKTDPFTGVATFDEKMVDTAAIIREKLGIPGFHTAEALLFRDKVEMKKMLRDARGFSLPTYLEHPDRDAAQKMLLEFGAIVAKPKNSLGSKGVFIIKSHDDMERWLASDEPLSDYEIEEFVEGTLYHVNALVIDGRIVVNISAPYVPGMGNIDFIEGTPFASYQEDQDELNRRLHEVSLEIIEKLGMKNGVTHLEVFVTPDDRIVFCEVAARPGGGGIVYLIELACGINFNSALLLIEAGRTDLIPQPSPQVGRVSGLVGIRLNRISQLLAVPAAEQFDDPWIKFLQIDCAAGETVLPASHCTDFVGLFVFHAQNSQTARQRIDELDSRFMTALKIKA